ncbi:transposase IS4 family [Cupriavidus necator N-1]|uniref:Transposase IS4 family n=1 Tax=Cupriavidus necator (strain ATCC 43291 / DSM 13513 / CCUG 52238 / LMG 8453 / N-1) TaxID=1042878 RepID=G0EYW3_CUPNN|nr:transposase IS4 family [Cupriavidus necator N-1]
MDRAGAGRHGNSVRSPAPTASRAGGLAGHRAGALSAPIDSRCAGDAGPGTAQRCQRLCQQERHRPSPRAAWRQAFVVAVRADRTGVGGSGCCALQMEGLGALRHDGTTFRTADSPENRLYFGAQSYASGKVASYPQVRGVSLTAVPTHLVADIAFGRYGCNEMLYAKPLIERIPDDSLTIFDKGFLAAEILWGLRMGGSERHFLIPAKKNLQWELLSGSADDGIVQMKVSPQARRKNPALPETWTARAIRDEESERVLLTSLTDRRRFKAADILACYRRRWEIETSYRELKQTMLGAELTLRSRQPEGVHQEIWGALIAYNLVRLEMAKAALEARVEPTDLSFVLALRLIQGELTWAAGMAPGKLPAHLQRMRAKLQLAIVQKRRGRKCPRVVKALPKRYTVRFLRKDLN